MQAASSTGFDAAAAAYDEAFTHRRLGRWLREAVWARLGVVFAPGDRVLDLGCGTGEDAIWLAQRGVRVLATDAAPAMLAAARRKAASMGVDTAGRITFAELDLASLTELETRRQGDKETGKERSLSPCLPVSGFDGAFSNFGPLNCLADRRPVAEALARWVRPGGVIVMVVMGPLCPWEIAWHLAHGAPRTALRRLRSGVVAHVGAGATVRVWYPSPRRLRAEFAPHFRHVETLGVGALLPPSELAHLADRLPRLFETLALLDRRFGRAFPWTWLNDHYLSVFERQ
jgi:SAM-dependent methyltransferase